jgi:hypothetical protein
VDGRWIGTSDRTDNWSDSVPAAVLSNVRYVAIVQKWDPDNVFNDINVWLSGIAKVAQELAPIIQAIGTIVAAL